MVLDKPVNEVLAACLKEDVIPGLSLAKAYPEFGNALLVNITELHSADDVDLLVSLLKNA